MSDQKYMLYEEAVQSPEHDVAWVAEIYRSIFHKEARRLREDFCGTFKFSTEWVKLAEDKLALCLDLDSEPLSYGRRKHFAKLTAQEKKRLTILKKDVRTVTTPKVDVVAAYNFSFYIFKQRQDLVRYFQSCLKSIDKSGMLVLEMAGGPGMIEKIKERTTLKKMGKPWFTYIWDQRSYDPITNDALYSIHFKFPNGKEMKDVFTYDWRVWSIPEVKDAMIEAGFDRTVVYWEFTNKRTGDSEYMPAEKGDNPWSWLAFVVGVKGK
jgi:hypothetical protein